MENLEIKMENVETKLDMLIEQQEKNFELVEELNEEAIKVDDVLKINQLKLSIMDLELIKAKKIGRVVKNVSIHTIATSMLCGGTISLLNIQQELIPVINSIGAECNHSSIRNSIIFTSLLVILGANLKIALNNCHQKYVEEHLSLNEYELTSYGEIKQLLKEKKKMLKKEENNS